MTRRTVAAPVAVVGVGLHLGMRCDLTFRAGSSGRGIVFRRTDLPGSPEIPARVDQVTETERRTQLGRGSTAVHTVEHVLSAVTALTIDDLIIDMTGPEPPIGDGSSTAFFDALLATGIVELPGEPTYLTLREPVRVIDGSSVYEAVPSDGLSLDVSIEFPHPAIGRQSGRYGVVQDEYKRELAGARTFGFTHEVEELRSKGLIKGASTENAIVLDEGGVISGPLRWPNEFLRHKVLDCIGDLALAGARVKAHVTAVRPSHRGTVTLVREMVRSGEYETATKQGRNAMSGESGEVSQSSAGPSGQSGQSGEMSIEQIMKVLPHRYPFLLVDRILEMNGRQRIVGIKNVTINEPFFQGHFPGHPIMPGVLIIEAMAQVGGMLLMGGIEGAEQKVVYFMSLDNVRFRKPVRPGDQLRFELDVVQIRGAVCKMHGVAKVDGDLVAEADMAAMVRDR